MLEIIIITNNSGVDFLLSGTNLSTEAFILLWTYKEFTAASQIRNLNANLMDFNDSKHLLSIATSYSVCR